MKKTAVVFWSGTGNTEAMANAVLEGMKAAGADATLLTASEADAADLSAYDALALGCPAMGAEVLEEEEFDPMFQSVKASLAGKPVALFGSYGWGDGEWMRNWETEWLAAGATLACDSVICQDEPDEQALAECEKLGQALVS